MPKLPPTDRDFEIYESVHIQHRSTWHMAEPHHISQTRVRQIIRRVIEWLGEVIPPQTKIAKEQKLRLARDIAADRFQHQLEEVASLWEETRDSKYAGIRIRLTTAQARLGVVGGLAAGLAADAIEGLEVPAYVPPPEPAQAPSASEGRRREAEVAGSETVPYPAGAPDIRPAAGDFVEFTWEFIAAREAAGSPIPAWIIERAIDRGVLSRPDATSERETAPDSNPKSKIQNLKSSAPAAGPSSPPVRDFSASAENFADGQTTVTVKSHETAAFSSTCDNVTAERSTTRQPANTPSQPLLTTHNPLPVTELELTPDRAGASVSTKALPHPYSPLPTHSPLNPEPHCQSAIK